MIVRFNSKIFMQQLATQGGQLLLVLCFLSLGFLASAQQHGFQFMANEEQPAQSSLIFQLEDAAVPQINVYVGKRDGGVPPVAGRWVQKRNQLEFIPAYGWAAGQAYTAVLEAPGAASKKRFYFQIPWKKANGQAPEVLGIFPTAEVLPANQLKLYVQFSKPMQLGYAYDKIQLFDENGTLIDQPFLLLKPELWDDQMQRLSLWFDPGRLKRDLVPNRELGTPLEEGKTYTLVVSSDWPDRDGQELKTAIRKTFTVGPADRTKPSVQDWEVETPAVGSRAAIRINFGESLDYALAQRGIHLFDAKGNEISVQKRLVQGEAVLILEPPGPWTATSYKIRVEAVLEDLAGNNLNRLFDRDLKDPKQTKGEELYYWLEIDLK